MRETLFRPIARGVQQNCAKLERSIVSNPELPVGRNITFGILEISIDDCEQVGNLPRAGLV